MPIATELVPYLAQAIAQSPSVLVFPDHDGSMLSRHTPLEEVLRRALARAGIVEGYRHVCRHKGCGHTETVADTRQRLCPEHGHKLWPTPIVRQIRFHDLRHTTASLLMMRGANPAAVQRILRHSDPKITTEVYGHLAPGYLKAEADRLSFQPSAPPEVEDADEAQAAAASGSQRFVTPLLPSPEAELQRPSSASQIREGFRPEKMVGVKGFEPSASWSRTKRSTKLSYTPLTNGALVCLKPGRLSTGIRRRRSGACPGRCGRPAWHRPCRCLWPEGAGRPRR
jgi:hypothetical protein